MGGGGAGAGGGGGMLRMRSVGRALSKGSVASSGNGSGSSTQPQEPFSSSSSNTKSKFKSSSLNPLSLGSSFSSSHYAKSPVSELPIWYSSSERDEYDWVSVYYHEIEDDGARGSSGHCIVGGPVPSENEVDEAVCALKQVLGPSSRVQPVKDKYYYKLDNELDQVTIPGLVNQVSSDGSETDWVEPSLLPYNSKMLQADGSDRVYYAFHLLQTEPSVQRLVKSISSDKAVWDAVLNNEVVRELRESISADEEHVPQSPNGSFTDGSPTANNVVMWIFDSAKAKFMEVIEIITRIVYELFQSADHKTDANAEGLYPLNEYLRTSFMLSIMVLLVVVVRRAHGKGMA